MLENYYYSIPKWKKMAYLLFIGLTLSSLLAVRVNSGLFEWAAQTITDNITNEIFESINQAISGTLGKILDAISNVFTEPWGPQLRTFGYYTRWGGANGVTILESFGIWIGIFLATLIYFFSMFTFFFSGKITDSRDTPISLTVKYVVALAICYKLETVVNTFLSIIDEINTLYVQNLLSNALSQASGGFLVLLGEAFDGWLKRKLSEGFITTLIPGGQFILLIISIIVIWKVIKGLFKLYAEMISRYIVSCFLVMLFAAFSGTIVSNNTSQIFKSYLRTLFSSFFVLLFNIVWFKMCILTIVGMISSYSILQYLFLLELMHFGLKVDGMLRSMGLGVATGGARIASAVGGSGRNMMNALRAGNDLRKAGGNLMKEKGAGMLAAGNPKGMETYKAGSKLAAGVGDILNGKADPNNSMLNACKDMAEANRKMPDSMISAPQAAKIMNDAMRGNTDAITAMGALSNNKIKEGAQAFVGNSGTVNDAHMVRRTGADGLKHTGIEFNASSTSDPDKTYTGTLAGEGMFAEGKSEAVAGAEGIEKSIDNAMTKGETMSASDFAEMGSTEANSALNSAGVDLGETGTIECMGKNRDDEDAFRCMDENNNIQGTIQGDEFIANSAIDGTNESMLSDIKDSINDMGYDCPDFKEVAGSEGVYKTVGTNEDGDTKTFTATDRGVNTNSSINDDTNSFRFDDVNESNNVTSFDVNASETKDNTSNRGIESSNEEFISGRNELEQITDENREKLDNPSGDNHGKAGDRKRKRR